MTSPVDSAQYLKRKEFFNQILAIYGRKPVLEALQNTAITCYRVHLAETNKKDGIISRINTLAEQRNVEVVFHSRESLAHISKNRKQDQGVAADLMCPQHQTLQQFISRRTQAFSLLAVDGINNPQNLGMIIRSVAASPMTGLLLASNGNTGIGPLAIKASSGSVFNCPIVRCEKLLPALEQLRQDADICVLAGNSDLELKDYHPKGSVIYVLGNETEGVSIAVSKLANYQVRIPMNHQVESLNVAVTAALIAFRQLV